MLDIQTAPDVSELLEEEVNLAPNSGFHGAHNDGPEPALGTRTIVALAIELLMDRGFIHLGDDPVGLPCYRSPSGALLVGVGSCRSLAYTKVDGRLQVIAAARTATLICRIDNAISERDVSGGMKQVTIGLRDM
jgi:hypothetical protein